MSEGEFKRQPYKHFDDPYEDDRELCKLCCDMQNLAYDRGFSAIGGWGPAANRTFGDIDFKVCVSRDGGRRQLILDQISWRTR